MSIIEVVFNTCSGISDLRLFFLLAYLSQSYYCTAHDLEPAATPSFISYHDIIQAFVSHGYGPESRIIISPAHHTHVPHPS
jgi:hypothetical protein